METFANYFAPIFGGSLILFMWICGNYKGPGIFSNYYSKSCYRARQRSILWQILGNIGMIIPGVMSYLMATDTIVVSTGLVILGVGLPLVLALCAFGGFDFTILPEDEV